MIDVNDIYDHHDGYYYSYYYEYYWFIHSFNSPCLFSIVKDHYVHFSF